MKTSPLFYSKRFLPLFSTLCLGAFNDNLFKNALVILMSYVLAEQAGMNAQIMVTIAAAVFIIPFFLFSATAGQLADKYEKSLLIRRVKFVEIILMLMAVKAFYSQEIYSLLVILFLMGTQSSFFGPLKYSILPDHLKENELVKGNAYIEAGTFLSILLGTILAGILILSPHGIVIVSLFIVLFSVLGFISSLYIPKAEAPSPALTINWNIFTETWHIMRLSRHNHDVFLAILGISWFWLVGATFLSQFPNFAKETIGANEHVVTLFLAIFSIGIAIGSLMCHKLLKGEVKASYVPLGALGMSLFTIDLFLASHGLSPADSFIGIYSFLSSVSGIRITVNLLLISIAAGIYIVPLYAIMQHRSAIKERARIIASNNVLNALFMVTAALLTILLLALDFTVPLVFLTTAILNIAVSIYICKLLPANVIRGVLRFFFRLFYRVEVRGIDHVKQAGKRVLIIANHTSMLDAMLIAAYIPEQLTFAINTHQAKRWFIKPLLSLVKAFPLDPTNPMATKALIEEAKKDNKIVIFPEGRLTATGSMMKIYEGTGMVVDKSDATLLPIRIDGAQYTPFSRLKGKVRLRLFPKITMTILAPQRFDLSPAITGRQRRSAAGEKLYEIMSDMMFLSSRYKRTLFEALLDAKAIHGKHHPILDDATRNTLHYGQLISRSFILGNAMAQKTKAGEHVGVLLPNMANSIVAFFALQSQARIPAMLNFSTGAKVILSACQTAKVNTIYSSRNFVKMGQLEDVITALENAKINVIYLEDLKEEITLLQKIYGLVIAKLPTLFYKKPASDDIATILFTSGSEGTPKGVALSHENLLANIYQLASRVDFGPKDIVFNALPIFHSFGLTGGTLLPVLSGIKTFFYPSPLHYRIVPELVYDCNATIMFGTDTFLSGYARFAHPYDFYAVRYVFAGAEKLKDETRQLYSDKFGVRIFEGYGATETAPVLSTNTPMHHKAGTVGQLMPMIKHRLEPVPGVDDGGRLFVSGPNIMKGYFLAETPGKLIPPKEGWYDTGDIVALDEENYITIKGRAKRFAKIGGEMISLTAVESYLSELWEGFHHAVISIPDAKKGEQLVLVTDYQDAKREDIISFVKKQGIAELSIPKTIKIVDKMPLLGTGKTDYVAIEAL